MTLTADEWHILAICVFPSLSLFGIGASIFLSASNNRTALSMGIIFSAGVLMSASLVHMLPHATEAMEMYFEENERGHEIHSSHDYADNHTDHDEHLRLMRWLQEDEEEGHASHAHAFPWAQTIFSIAFIFLLCVEATMERFIDVYFSGRKGNFFSGAHHGEEEEELMYAQGYSGAEHERIQKESEEQGIKDKEGDRMTDYSRRSVPLSDMPPLKEGYENEDKEKVRENEKAEGKKKLGEDQKEKAMEDNSQLHGPADGDETHGHSHAHSHGEEGDAHCHSHTHNHVVEGFDHATSCVLTPCVSGTTTLLASHLSATSKVDKADGKCMGAQRVTEEGTEIDEKEDIQPVAKPPGPSANIQIPFPDCKKCIIAYDMPLSDCKDCRLLRKEDVGYEDPDVFHRHHHHNNLHVKRGSASQDGASDKGLPGDLRWRAPRRMSAASNTSGKSSLWGKSVGRPMVVSYGISAPVDEPEQQQTINPWVAILLTLVLCIHEIIESLTFGALNDVEALRTTFIAIAAHKAFAGLSLGSSLVASGYWESNRTMFFVLSGTWIASDVISQGIGMAIGQALDHEGNIVGAVFTALTGGSFLFVATVELIPGELEKMRKYNLPLFPILFSLCLGFGLMTMLAKWGV
jgi:zinc transporter ZupT